ncbi:hypothetical protein AB0L97_33045 [Nocardia sp. NPDC051911]|uniref:phage fiber-tail adaptor protein n=1 Tax=Nocardia sp. NPDC051911 TaxID=3154648 RepID=UPI003439E98F
MTNVLIVRDVLAADGSRLTTQGMVIDSGDLAHYRAYGWRLPLGAPAIPSTQTDYPGFEKDPDATQDWLFDWSAFLTVGETLTTSVYLARAGVTITPAATVGAVTRVWVTGGVLGEVYVITNRITTSDGRTEDRSFTVTITQR